MSTLVHRQPNFDFSGVPARWAPHLEFASTMTAASTSATAAEPYLNQVMAQAKPMLGARHAHLADEIDLFIKQEATHHKVHTAYNAEIRATYPFMAGHERAKRDDYRDFLVNRSHKFNCAYAAAFETLALSMSLFVLEHATDLVAGADSRTLAMWRWHLGEEYEHRSLCHDVYNAIYGDYLYRARMVIFTYRHLAAHNGRLVKRVLEHERAGMSEEEKARSLGRQKAFKKRFAAFHLPRIVKLLVPGYDPGRALPPMGLDDALSVG